MVHQGEILKKLIKKRGFTQDGVAKKLKRSREWINQMLKDSTIDPLYISGICEIIGVSRDVVNSGDLNMVNEPTENYSRTTKGKGVPAFNVDFTAGDIAQFQDDQEQIVGYVDLEGFRTCVGFVRVRGSSMYPELVAGDYIGLEPDKDLSIIEYGQIYAVVTKTNKRMVKIIRKGKDDTHLILKSVNPEYDEINIHKDQIDKLYKVHGPIRDSWQ